ncbi:nucleotidyltransferase domain-containing protein [Pseudoalteromonas piscicida]|uniref:nucleotidyltransferase domain-containing protein n=1 Tax=Pseudoalteromonas piscicida TaxID=43662 RepID=UPI0030B16B57
MDIKRKSKEKLNAVRALLKDSSELQKHSKNIVIIVTGSYGRDEGSEESDMDWIIICNDSVEKGDSESILSTVSEVIEREIQVPAGSTNTFENIINEEKLLKNFGGDKETNQDFTRRMLYVLESKYLFNENKYNFLKRQILNTYIKSDIPDQGVNRFMLNDLIRYYRTMCTDYEYKVNETSKSSEWGLRKIKLRFSRKLIYFAGILTIAQTSSFSREKKIEETLRLLEMTPAERLQNILSTESAEKIIKIYNQFLKSISDPTVRGKLKSVTRENRNEEPMYRDLKNLSQQFLWELEKSLLSTFPPSHPIHVSLIF